MPRTLDHIVETHRIAAELRAAGKPVWAERVKLGNLFHNDELTFEEKRDRLVGKLRATRWYAGQDVEDSRLTGLVDELEETERVEEFDWVLDEIYDFADHDRVWIGQ